MQPTQIFPPSLLSKQLHSNLHTFADLRSRPETELKIAVQLLSSFPLFQNPDFHSPSFLSCLRNLTYYLDYQIHPPNTVFYHEGTTAHALYFILQGTVNTYVPKTSQELKAENLEEAYSSGGESAPKSAMNNLSFFDSPNLKAPERRIQRERNRSQVSNDDNSPIKRSLKISSSNQSTLTDIQNKTLRDVSQKSQRSLANRKTSILLNEELDEIQVRSDLKRIMDKATAENTAKLLGGFANRAYKYFLGETCLYKLGNELNSGVCLGNLEYKESVRALTHTAVTATETHVLVCQHKDFLSCFQEILFEQDQKLLLFQNIFANITKKSVINIFANGFRKMSQGVNDVIFSEGAQPNGLYLIHKGEIGLSKLAQDHMGLSPTRNKSLSKLGESLVQQKNMVPFSMMRLGPRQFFGEEVLYEEPARRVTALVTTSVCEVYFLPIEQLEGLREICKVIIEHLKGQYHQKLRVRDQRLKVLAEVSVSPEPKERQNQIEFLKYESTRQIEKYIRPPNFPFVRIKMDRLQGLMADELEKGRKKREMIAIAKKSKPINYLQRLREDKEAENFIREKRAASWDKDIPVVKKRENSELDASVLPHLKMRKLPKKLSLTRQRSLSPEMQDFSTKMDTDGKYLHSKESFSKGNSKSLNEEFNLKVAKVVFGVTDVSGDDDGQLKRSFLTEHLQKDEVVSLLKGRSFDFQERRIGRSGSFQGIGMVVPQMRMTVLPSLYGREERRGVETERIRIDSLEGSSIVDEVKEIVKPRVTMKLLNYYKQRVDVIKQWSAFREAKEKAEEDGKMLRVVNSERSFGVQPVKIEETSCMDRLKPGLTNVKRMFARLNKRLKDNLAFGDIESSPVKIQLQGDKIIRSSQEKLKKKF